MIGQFFQINTAIGIGLTVHPDGSLTANACKIIRNGSQLDFEIKFTGLKTLNELSEKLPKNLPVSVNISGKGILIKQVEKLDELTKANFSQVLPNANFHEFYMQNFTSGEYSFISVIRKSEADKWLQQLNGLGFNVVILSLNVFPVDFILPQLNLYGQEIIFDGHSIQLNEQKNWYSYHYQENELARFPIKIETEKIEEKLVMAYATVFQLVMSAQLNPIQVISRSLSSAYEKAQVSKWLKSFGVLVLLIVFILLLINFLLFSWFDTANVKLSAKVNRSAQNTNGVRDFEEQVKTKEQKLKILGWAGDINKARLIDQLASDLPEEITWKSIEVNPIDISATRVQKTVMFKDGQIRITGFSQQIIPVNEWMARVRIKKWVKGVQLENYGLNQELNTGQFTITITY